MARDQDQKIARPRQIFTGYRQRNYVSLDWHPGLCQTVFCEDQGLEFDALMALFGFNKQKVLASAEKYVQQGKLQNAIAEYEKILKNDPKDLTVTNTVGDLYAKMRDSMPLMAPPKTKEKTMCSASDFSSHTARATAALSIPQLHSEPAIAAP